MKQGTVFQRYEFKYLMTRGQQARLLSAAGDRLRPDEYSHSSIRNLYVDTPDFRLIRRSLEKPVYKEKLRLRSYGRADWEHPVFMELKKKYRSIVYKRRLILPYGQAADCLTGDYLTNAAQEGNQYAQYTLGKLYLTGEDVAWDQEQAYRWFWESASQGNEYAQFFLDHFNDSRKPNVLLSATKLLHHMGRIFQDNSIPPCPPGSQKADRKLLQKIRQKKIALGHKPDDHEVEQNMGGMTMGGM